MLNNSSCGCVITIMFTWANLINRAAHNDTEYCGYNTFKDGNVCRDCPVGYFGVNCSDKCSNPTYGVLCSQVCTCTACDHVLGCNLTTESPEIGPTTVKHKSSSELHTSIAKNITNQKTQVETTAYTPEERIGVTKTQIQKKDRKPEMIIVILIGSFICFVLLFEIRRAIYLYMESISETSCA